VERVCIYEQNVNLLWVIARVDQDCLCLVMLVVVLQLVLFQVEFHIEILVFPSGS
jgi:hypothetical protein